MRHFQRLDIEVIGGDGTGGEDAAISTDDTTRSRIFSRGEVSNHIFEIYWTSAKSHAAMLRKTGMTKQELAVLTISTHTAHSLKGAPVISAHRTNSTAHVTWAWPVRVGSGPALRRRAFSDRSREGRPR